MRVNDQRPRRNLRSVPELWRAWIIMRVKPTTQDMSPAAILKAVGPGTEIIVEDRSGDPKVREKGIAELKAAGITGRWLVIKPKTETEG